MYDSITTNVAIKITEHWRTLPVNSRPFVQDISRIITECYKPILTAEHEVRKGLVDALRHVACRCFTGFVCLSCAALAEAEKLDTASHA